MSMRSKAATLHPPRTLTKEERNAINTLKKLANNWPATLVLFGDGKLRVLDASIAALYHEYDSSGKGTQWAREVLLADVDIPCDGGDPW